MSSPLTSISDGITNFVGDLSDAWSGNQGGKSAGQGAYLSYPRDLGNDYSDMIEYNSDDQLGSATSFADSRADSSFVESGDTPYTGSPFIMFEFLRSSAETSEDRVSDLAEEISLLNNSIAFRDDVTFTTEEAAEIGAKSLQNDIKDLEGKLQEAKSIMGKKGLNNTIAMYMTSGIQMSDGLNYASNTRKAAAAAEDYDNIQLSRDGLTQAAANPMAVVAGAGGLAVGAAKKFKWMKKLGGFGSLITAGIGAVGADVFADEYIKNSGRIANPNPYMQYQGTEMRTFSFNWKMLPDSSQESFDCIDIIEGFRLGAAADKINSVSIQVPDEVIVSFHGVTGVPALPPLIITNVSVNYNPNAASFFQQNNTPVEIDLTVSFQEVAPIYRSDIEEMGY
jgi:hypothetical protein